jgi:hypothetical protein
MRATGKLNAIADFGNLSATIPPVRVALTFATDLPKMRDVGAYPYMHYRPLVCYTCTVVKSI